MVITGCSLFHIVSHFLSDLFSIIHITSACLLCSKMISRNRCSQRPFQTSERLLENALCILLSFRTQIIPKANVCTNSPRRITRAPKIPTSCRPHGFPRAANGTSPPGEAFYANRQKGFPPAEWKKNLNSERKTQYRNSENRLSCKHNVL